MSKKVATVILITIISFFLFTTQANASSANKYNEGAGVVYEYHFDNGTCTKLKLEAGILYYNYDSNYQEISREVNAVAFDKDGRIYYIYCNKWLFTASITINTDTISISIEKITKDAIGFTYEGNGVIATNCYTNISYIPLPVVNKNPVATQSPIPTAMPSTAATPIPTVTPKPSKYVKNEENIWTYIENEIPMHIAQKEGDLLYVDQKLVAKDVCMLHVGWSKSGSEIYYISNNGNGYVFSLKTSKTKEVTKNVYKITYTKLGFFKKFNK